MTETESRPRGESDAGKIQERIHGVLLGTAVGDAVGLPAEGLTPEKIRQLGWAESGWRHRFFFFGRGMVSDDTEHTILVAQAMLRSGRDAEKFRRCFARSLRWWILALPAGVGLATARACLKLWLGVSPRRSGVFSAGNGPAMRSAVIGARFFDDADRRREWIRISTETTHRDPRALTGALAMGELTAAILREAAGGIAQEVSFEELRQLKSAADGEWDALIDQMEKALGERREVAEFAEAIGCDRGVTGYVYHSVPVAIYAWLRHRGRFSEILEAVWNCGGDTDTVGAMAGALAGAEAGSEGIPRDWVEGLRDWPRGGRLLADLSKRLAADRSGPAPGPARYAVAGVLPRNLFFLAVVIAHGFLRIIPGSPLRERRRK